MLSRRAIGNAAEDRACEYLKNLGYEILQRNYCVRGGEIDIIARDGNTTVFVEVKYRTNDRYGTGLESITPTKLERMRRAIGKYMEEHNTDDVRVDAMEMGKSESVKYIMGISLEV